MKKLTYEFIKSEFEKEGYTLVSKEYINSKTKLDYKCSKGHEHSIRLNAWQRGHRCSTCARVIKPTLELVKQSFEKDDYILLSKEYINNNTKLDYKCPKNHEYSITWRNWKQGNRCLICAGRITSTMEQVKKSFENEGYTLISKEYKSSKTKLYYICSNGHERSTTWNIWKNGHRCIICSGKMKLTLEYIKESFTESGYILLSKI